RWWAHAKKHYVRFEGDGSDAKFARYFDPFIEYLCEVPIERASGLVIYLAPQNYTDAQRLYDVSAPPASVIKDPKARRGLLADSGWFALYLWNAREMGDAARFEALSAVAEELCDPTWDRDQDEFYYRFGNSEYPKHIRDARAKISPRIPLEGGPSPDPHPLG